MLKVIGYNILLGGESRLPLLLEVLRSQSPDAIALLEANDRGNVERIAGALGMDHVYGEANSEYAIAWLSRLPILRSRNHRLAVLAKTLLEIEVEWEGTRLGLFATHLVHGRSEADARRRIDEVAAILDVLNSARGRPHLLLGDFNAVHPRDPLGVPPPGQRAEYVARRPIALLLDAGYLDCYRETHPETPGYTYTASHPWLRLDYAFASPELAASLAGCEVIADRPASGASDHLPIGAVFARYTP
jgi:endonuclease/exonuclease/phosphatase family metal-dependent hydrolase